MSLYESTTLILSIFTITLSMVSILIAIGSSRQTSREATKQIEAIRESSKKDIEHQAKLVWGIIQVAYMQNMFELSRDKNQLLYRKRVDVVGNGRGSDVPVHHFAGIVVDDRPVGYATLAREWRE